MWDLSIFFGGGVPLWVAKIVNNPPFRPPQRALWSLICSLDSSTDLSVASISFKMDFWPQNIYRYFPDGFIPNLYWPWECGGLILIYTSGVGEGDLSLWLCHNPGPIDLSIIVICSRKEISVDTNRCFLPQANRLQGIWFNWDHSAGSRLKQLSTQITIQNWIWPSAAIWRIKNTLWSSMCLTSCLPPKFL